MSEWVSSSRRASKRSYHFAWIITGPKKFPVTRTTSIQVLDLPAGQVGTPDVFQSLIYEETIVRLKASKCFREVLRAGEATQDNRNVLVLQLSIVAFQEGKPRIRELMGVAGKARATAEAVLRNKANEVLRDSIVNGVATGHADPSTHVDSWQFAKQNHFSRNPNETAARHRARVGR